MNRAFKIFHVVRTTRPFTSHKITIYGWQVQKSQPMNGYDHYLLKSFSDAMFLDLILYESYSMII